MFKSFNLAKEFAESKTTKRSKAKLIFEILLDQETKQTFGDVIWIVQDDSLSDGILRQHCQYESRTVGKFTIIRCVFDNLSNNVRSEEGILAMKSSPTCFKLPSVLLHKEEQQVYVITSLFADYMFSCYEIFLAEIAICEKDDDGEEDVVLRHVIGNHDSWMCGRLLSTITSQENRVLLAPPAMAQISTRVESLEDYSSNLSRDPLSTEVLNSLPNGKLEFKKSYSIEDKYKAYCLSRGFCDKVQALISDVISSMPSATQYVTDAERQLEQDKRIRSFYINTEENTDKVIGVEVTTHPLKVRDFETGRMLTSPGFVIRSSLSCLVSIDVNERKRKDKTRFYPGLVLLDDSARVHHRSVFLFGSNLEKVLRLHFQGLFAEIVIIAMDIISSCKTIHGTRDAVLQSLKTRSR